MTPAEARMLARAIIDEWQRTVAPLNDELLTADECAALLRMSTSWVRKHKDELPHVKVGGELRFSKSQVLKSIMI